MGFVKKLNFKIILFIINKFLLGVHFFKLKRELLKFAGITIGKNTKVVGPIILNTYNVIIGDECWIGRGFTVDGNGKVHIGNKCDFAPEVLISTGSHIIGDSMRRAGEGLTKHTIIGSGTWVGTRSTIIEGSNIGDGCIVGACSLINKSFGNNLIIAGTPGKVIRNLQ